MSRCDWLFEYGNGSVPIRRNKVNGSTKSNTIENVQGEVVCSLSEAVEESEVQNQSLKVKSRNAGSSRSSKGQYFCCNCRKEFTHYRALKNHACDHCMVDSESGDSSGENDTDEDDSDSDTGKRNTRNSKSKRQSKSAKKSKNSKIKVEEPKNEDPVILDESQKLEWERIELEKEIVYSCIDHLYVDLMNDGNNDSDKPLEDTPYRCTVCRKVQPTLTEIRSHCLTHTTLKPYRCSPCKYSTKQKSMLIKHLSRHTAKPEEKDNPEDQTTIFNCELCIDGFENMMSLAAHFQRNHRTIETCQGLLLSVACEKTKRNDEAGTLFRCFFCFDNFEKIEDCQEHVQSRHFRSQEIIDVSSVDPSVKTWRCPLCHHTTNYAKPFLKHITKHKLIFSCRDCPGNFLSYMKLCQHIADQHVECDGDQEAGIQELAQLSLNDSWYLPEDVSKKLNAIIVKASQKLLASDDANLMKIISILKYKHLSPHIYEHIKQTLGKVECYECGRLFFSQAELKRHDGIHAVEKQFKCDRCEYSAATKDNLSRHIAKIHDKTVLKCPNCDFTTLCQTTLWKHKKTHQDKLRCPECQKKFEKLKQLRQHMIECHLDNNIKIVDEASGNVVKKSVANSSFKCPHCPRVFHRSIQEYKRHMWIHEDIKPIKCTKCSYRCRTNNHLQVHMRKHSSIKAHQCPECRKDFKSKGSLQYHIQRFHSDGQKEMYACSRCSYTTAQKGHLKLHERNHLVVRKFRCPMCDYSSNTQSSLKGHYKKKHKGEEFAAIHAISSEEQVSEESKDGKIPVYKCEPCEYRFTNITDCRRHYRIKHKLPNFNWNDMVIKVNGKGQ